MGALNFWKGLDHAGRSHVLSQLGIARQHPPETFVKWFCGSVQAGWLPSDRAIWLAACLPDCHMTRDGLIWQVYSLDRQMRSQALQHMLEQAHQQGHVPGWRHERFSFWGGEEMSPSPGKPALFDIERAGFRWLGVLSHAVHVNGFLADGRLWCGRRALHKPTDPGLLDNLSAGGLAYGESLADCLVREMAEEAGLVISKDIQLQQAGYIRTSRLEIQGWHDEVLHVFNATLPEAVVPINQDGEVSEFVCLSPSEVMIRIHAGEFSPDSIFALAQGLGSFPPVPQN